MPTLLACGSCCEATLGVSAYLLSPKRRDPAFSRRWFVGHERSGSAASWYLSVVQIPSAHP